MTREAIGIAFIGHGWMGRAHAHALHTLERMAPVAKRIRLVSVAGRSPERAEQAARRLGFERWTTDWAELIDDPEIDVVANLASNDQHVAPSIEALRSGRHVLCEKPLGRDLHEARAMLDAAGSSPATAACGFNYRFVPAIRLARELVSAGRLGAVRQFRAAYLQDWAASPELGASWRFDKAESGSGAVGDYSHIVDLLRYLAGEPRSVTAVLSRFFDERSAEGGNGDRRAVDVEDAYAAILELDGPGLATLEASRCATGRKGHQALELYGERGALWWNMEDLNRLHVFFSEDERDGVGGFRDVLVTEPEHPFLQHWWAPGHILGWEHTFVHQWRDFLEAALDGRPVSPDQASFEDGYRAAAVCAGILAAGEQGRRVELRPEPVEEPGSPSGASRIERGEP